MQRSFVAKTTVNFPDWELYVRMGDILVFNAANDNSLTVYRGGSIVKTIKTTPISIAAMLKTKMIEESAPTPKPVSPAPSKPVAVPKPIAKSKSEAKRIATLQGDDPIVAAVAIPSKPLESKPVEKITLKVEDQKSEILSESPADVATVNYDVKWKDPTPAVEK